MTPDLSIIIVNYNTREALQACLASISAERGELAVQTIVVDNGSRDGSPDMVRTFADVTLIEPGRNTWFTGGNNLGAHTATGEFVFILNPDTIIQPGALQRMVAYLRANPHVGAVACRMEYPGGGLQAICAMFPHYADLILGYTFVGVLLRGWRNQRRARTLYQDWNRDTLKAVEVIPDSCLMAPRALLEQVGYFDERLKLYFTEEDICYRIRATGAGIHYLPDALILHHEHASVAQVQRLASQVYFDDLLNFCHKYYGGARALLLRILIWPTRHGMDLAQRLRGERRQLA